MIIPLENYILVDPIKEDTVSGGIYVPQSENERPIRGKVLSVGDMPLVDYGEVRGRKFAPVNEGDIIVFKKWADQSVKYEGKEYLLVKTEDLIAKIV
jgi:chaperonin GroES